MATVGAVINADVFEPVLYTILFAAPPATLVAVAAVPVMLMPHVPDAPVPFVAGAPTSEAVKTTTPVWPLTELTPPTTFCVVTPVITPLELTTMTGIAVAEP